MRLHLRNGKELVWSSQNYIAMKYKVARSVLLVCSWEEY